MSESNRYNKTSIAKILLVLTLILLTMFTTTTLASIKLEAVNATNPIKLNANKDITLNLVLDTDTYKTNEEILAWAIFRIDNIPVASKEFDVEISKGDTIIDRFSTTKTYIATTIENPGIYKIKVSTEYQGMKVSTSKQVIIYEDKEETTNIEQLNKTTLQINIDSKQEVDPANNNITIKGNVEVQNNNGEIKLNLFIHKKGSDELTLCKITLEQSKEFQCQLNAPIEIGTYLIEANLNIINENSNLTKSKEIELYLKDSNEINLETEIIGNTTYEPIIITTKTEKQTNLGITIISPTNKETYKYTSNESFKTEFLPEEEGEYTVLFELTKSDKYRKVEQKITVHKSEQPFKITAIQKEFENNSITFNIELPSIKRNNNTNLQLNITTPEEGIWTVCEYIIQPNESKFNITCPTNTGIILGEYQTTAKIEINGTNLTTSTTFKIGIDESNIEITSKGIQRYTLEKIILKTNDENITKVYGNLLGEKESINLVFTRITKDLFEAEVFLTEKEYKLQLNTLNKEGISSKLFEINTTLPNQTIKLENREYTQNSNNTVLISTISEFNSIVAKFIGNGRDIQTIEFNKLELGIYTANMLLTDKEYTVILTATIENITIQEEFKINTTDNSQTLQKEAKINENVKWITIRSSNKIEVPITATEITIKDTDNNTIVTNNNIIETKTRLNPQELVNKTKELAQKELALSKLETQKQILDEKTGKIITKLIANNEISKSEKELNIIKNQIKEVIENSTLIPDQKIIITDTNNIISNYNEVIVEYKTPAPTKQEKVISENRKQVIVKSDFHYQNITTETIITPTEKGKVKLFWYINGTKTEVTNNEEINLEELDEDNDGLIEKLRWNTPHTSTQTFEIEIIIPENINIENIQTIDDKLLVVSAKINTTSTLKLGSIKGVFASEIYCGDLNTYIDSLNETEIENIYQYIQDAENDNLVVSKYNTAINQTYYNWNCEDTIVTFTLQDPASLEKENIYLQLDQEKEYITPNNNLNLEIIYSQEDLTNSSIKDVEFSIITTENGTQINPDEITIDLINIDDTKEQRIFTNISGVLTFTINKDKNLYKEIDITTKKDSSIKVQSIIINPSIENNINIGENVEFSIDNIISAEIKDIDDNNADFTTIITSTKITAVPNENIRPGLYQIIITQANYTQKIWFTYGLLAANLNKPIYHNEEPAKFEIVVLDNKGFLVKDADISIRIERPDGFLEILTTSSNEVKLTSRGTYDATYYLENLGNYNVTITATTNDKIISITKNILAKESYDFDIIRNSKTTIDPWTEDFTTEFTLKSYIGINKFTFTEKIPKEFNITKSNSNEIREDNEYKYLIWNNIDNSFVPKYTAQTPLLTPYLYNIGAAEITYGGVLGIGETKFIENRTWMLAIDPVSQGNALLFWASGFHNAEMQYSPRYRTFNPDTSTLGSTQSDIPNAPAGNFNHPTWLEVARHPFKPEVIAIWESNEGGPRRVYGAVWNGSSWGALQTFSADTGTAYKALDVAYESNSGNAMVVYAVTGSNVPRYRVWNGTTWTAEQNANDIGSTPRFIRLVANPSITSNELILATNDALADVNVQVWNGATWGAVNEVTNNCWADRQCFDIAYESTSGDALIAYRHDATTNIYYNTYSGGVWSGRNAQGSLTAQPRVIQLASDPNSNRIIAGIVDDNTQDFHTFMWSGAGWTDMGTPSTSVNYENGMPFDITFEALSGDAIIAYGEGTAMRYRIVASGTTTLGAEQTVDTWGWTIAGVRLEHGEFTDHVYLSGMTAYYDIGFGIWNGATWAETGLAIGGGLDTTHQQYRMLASTEFFNTKAPTASSYGLNITNGAYLRRNGQVLAYSYWNDADRGLTYPAYIEHNGNGTSLEKIITPTDKWANYTLDISNYTEFNHVGRVDVSNIRATDLGQYGETGYIGWFFILDESNVTTITRSQSIADQNELFNISCRVYDKDMTKTIEDYTVFFYINNTYVGNTRSNSTGWATYQTSISEPDFYRINCSIKNSTYYVIDTAENILSTTITILDSTAPEATLNLPDNNTQDIDGNIVFNYTVTDTYSNIASCELIINGTVQATDNTITQGINTFPIALANGRYLWSVNCTDDSTNNNEGHSISRIITVRPDTTPPVIQQLEPPNGADSFSFVQIKFNASDELSDVDSCTLILDGITNETKTVNYDGEIQTINLTLASGIHTWRVNCSDDSPQNNWILSNWWVFTVGNDNTPPVITILSPNDGATDTDGDIHIYFTVNDYMSEIDSCTLYVNGLANQTNNSVNESYTQHFLIPGLSEASYNYYISCIDDSTNSNWDNSETRTVIVNYDYDAPVITLLYPENEYQSISGNINFIYTVADETEIKNCSLLINGTINKTDTTITRGINQSFSLTNIPINKYEWNVECYDNSDSHNYNTGTALNFSVGPDTIGPEITLISPSNNSIDTDGEILFTYITNDVTSNIASCEVFVNGSSVDVDNTVSEKVYQFLTGTLTDGRYEWFISCTDDSPQANVETSPTQYFNVSVNFKTSYDIELDDHYVAQGELIAPNSSFRDFYNNPLDNAQSYAYIIRNLGVDNQTTGWWDNSWTRRVEIPVTNVGTNSYTNGIIRFTLDTQSLIAAGLLRADCADLRFADQGAIPLNFYFWNADRACNNAATDILLEMNNIWDSNTHRIGVYFNNSAASTQTTTHNEYLVVDNFDNGDTITGGYWSAGSTTPLGGVSISNAQRSDGTNSARLIVDCTGNACDWAIERTSFEKTIIVTEDSTLTWRWIRATATSDLRFYLDGTLTDTSGTAWATATENIPAGTHTIKWEFRTTGTGGAVATQTAYVDQVRIETNNINIGTTTTQSEPVTQLTTQTTNMEGQAFFSWDTTGQAYGNYAVTGYGKKSSYWSDYSGYHFKIGPDIEAPTFNTWGLNVTDGTIVHRGERVLAYSTWEDKVNLSNALAEHNGTGSFTNYTITGFTKDKTATANYILDTSDFVEFSELGRINVNTIYANDSSDNWNKTTPPKYFILTSESQLSDITTNATILTEGENISIDCRVLDEFTGNPIQNHNIMFYYNNNLIGTSSTDATGWATITTLANIPGTNVEIRCSIINNLDIYYYAGTPNSISTYVNVTDITPPNVTLYSPQNNTQKIFPTFALGFSSFDSGVLDTCSLYGSWGGWHLEQTKTSLDNGNFPTLNYFLPVTFSQGQFYWYVTCNDTQGNIGSSINFTFNVSLSAPTVTLVAPQNNGTMGAGELNLTFSANQPESEVGIMNCTLSINNVLNDTLIGPLIKTQNYNFTIPHITYGTYNWTVDCYANNTLSANATRTVNIIELDMDTIAGNKDIDRDSVSGAMQDDLKIIATELYGRENINVSFLVNLTDPIIGTEVNKIIGWNLTNSSGKTSITFNPNSSVYAGNYTIWTRFSNWTYSVSRDTEWFDIFAGININFNNPVINPNNHYYYGELLDIESSINSLGIESTSQLGIDYGLIPKVILESPNGAKNTNLTLPYITNNWTNSINTASIHDHGIWNATLGMNTTQYFIVNNVQSKTFYMNLTGFGIPTITRIIPQNNFATANPSITFEWTVNDSLENNNWCNLTIDGVVNRSNLPTFNNTPYSIIIPGFSEGQHNWSLICWDYANNTNSTNTWNFTLDLTNPQINFTSPTEINNIVVNRNWTFVNVTVIELNLDTITLEWNNVNETLPCTGTSPNYFCEVNKTNLIDGNYSYIVYANDSLGNENKTEYRYIGIDTTNPLVDYALPTLPNASSTNHNWLYVRIDVTEPYLDTAILEWNGVNETMTCAGVAPNRFCYVNKTSLPDGDYTFKTYVNDTMSHRNQTIYRVNYIDTTNPLIQFVPLTDYSNFVTTRNWTYINVTVNETTLRNVTLQWNGVNESLICIGSTPNYYCGINKTNLIDWNYSYIVYANDSLGNKNNTEIRYIGIDTTNPLVNYSAQTLANASSTNNNWLYVRIDVTESYLDTATLEWNNVNETMTCAGVEPNRFCYVNKTSLADGTYTFKTYVNDTMSHNNQTVYRVNYVDSTAPKIQFVAPTESTNTVIPRNWTVINVTINETTLENVTLQWNGVNEPVTCIGSGPNYYCELNKSSLTDGNYSYFIFVNDSVGNSNNTELRYIGIDTTNPLVDYALPTLPNASSTNNNWLYVRIDVTEPYLDTAILEWNSVNETMTC
ncbi:hypothetical protein JXM83_00150, partial [Candidatus Woesearchaeota archaeon]|nr:hypothetical protein [Candidatus Woesearchaeota archaeon]